MNLASLGQRIKKRREQLRMTQAQLANTLLITAQAVSKWERGENAPDISMLQNLSFVLGRSIDWILGGYEQKLDTFTATVFCTSLRNFAKRSTTSSPKSIAFWINGIFSSLTESILEFDGIPVKYVGDGFLAYFSEKNSAERALEASIRTVDTIRNDDLIVTLNHGEIYLGAVGHHDYSTMDIMGSTVNNAFLLNHWGSENTSNNILLHEAVYDQVNENIHEKLSGFKQYTIPSGSFAETFYGR